MSCSGYRRPLVVERVTLNRAVELILLTTRGRQRANQETPHSKYAVITSARSIATDITAPTTPTIKATTIITTKSSTTTITLLLFFTTSPP